ncbi:ethanolamine permease, partial [Paraburkholderia sp. SIMBA_009]
AIVAALVCLGTMVYFNGLVAMVFIAFLAVGYAYFIATRSQRASAPADVLLEE